MDELIVETREKEGPTSLTAIQLFGRLKIRQVLMISPNLYLVSCPFKEMTPFLQGTNNGEQLFVMNLIVALDF